MTRNYLITLAAVNAGWDEYLQRPSPAHPLSFMGADAIWSAVQAGGGGLGAGAGGTHRARTAVKDTSRIGRTGMRKLYLDELG